MDGKQDLKKKKKGCELLCILIQLSCDVIERLDHPISFLDSGEVAKELHLESEAFLRCGN